MRLACGWEISYANSKCQRAPALNGRPNRGKKQSVGVDEEYEEVGGGRRGLFTFRQLLHRD